jgi:two-component system sensor histidine kinase KdpD
MNEDRPDPDSLLARVRAEEARALRGKLKIFFGATAGVGKTYAMLTAARRKKAEGADVVVGYVEPHGRPETERLLEGLESLPHLVLPYGGSLLHEFDLDAALARKPALVLVDELAHTNAVGARHEKRWQDIEELRNAGIDVWTTVNVQHLESLNDVIASITSVRMQETVPDTVFEGADEVELIDLAPDDLLQRLREGKVYVPERAVVALEHFFRPGNLIALRELALRKTAERVDAAMDRYRATEGIAQPWAAGEKVLVGIGPRSDGESLVRAGKRLAVALHAPWIVVYVETPDLIRLSETERNQRIAWLRFAERLGAETVTLGGHNAGQEISNYARARNVSRILLGQPSRRGLARLLRPSTVDYVLARVQGLDVTIVKTTEASIAARNPILARSAAFLAAPVTGRRVWAGYAATAAAVALATLIGWISTPFINDANVVMLYLLAIVLVALRFGQWPSVAASAASVVAYNLFFIEPLFTLDVADAQYLVTFVALMTVGILIGWLMSSVRMQARVAGQRERRTALLYAMARELAATRGSENIARVAVRHVGESFEAQAVVLLPDPQRKIRHPSGSAEPASLRSADLSVAQWVFEHGRPAGIGTDTLPGTPARFLPLTASDVQLGQLGVLAVLPANTRRIMLPEQAHLLETFAVQVALALERAALAERAQSAAVNAEAESVRSSLLAAISHDMRTPLAVISGAASALMEERDLAATDRGELARSIYDEAAQMTQVVANVLDMTRLESGRVKLHAEWISLEEVAASALRRLQVRLAGHNVSLQMDRNLPLTKADAVLIEQLLSNLLDNVARHTPPGTSVSIGAQRGFEEIEVTVADDGPGLPPDVDPDTLFDKFERGHIEGAQGGVGLGLAICRAIARAHGGEIRAERIPAGGALITLTLPLAEEAPAVPRESEA